MNVPGFTRSHVEDTVRAPWCSRQLHRPTAKRSRGPERQRPQWLDHLPTRWPAPRRAQDRDPRARQRWNGRTSRSAVTWARPCSPHPQMSRVCESGRASMLRRECAGRRGSPQRYLDGIEDCQEDAIASVGKNDGALDRRQTQFGRIAGEVAVDLHRDIVARERNACALGVEAAARHRQVKRRGEKALPYAAARKA